MKFMIYTHDKPDQLDVRMATRTSHLDFLGKAGTVQVHGAGPWLDKNQKPIGSLLVVEANCMNCVEEWVKNDPYKLAGLTADVIIHPLGGWLEFSR